MATFTTDWFSGHADVWNDVDGPLGDLLRRSTRSTPISALEIGVWEGRSTMWLLTRLCSAPGSKVVSIDHFDNGDTKAGLERFKRVLDNTRGFGHVLELRQGWSSEVLIKLRLEERTFDLAYIDGSHHRLETMEDAINAWRCLTEGGIIVFDDYEWDGGFEWADGVKPVSMHHPKVAIDSFLRLVEPEAETLHVGYQVFVRKLASPRHAIRRPTPIKSLLPEHGVAIEAGIMLPLRCSDDWPVLRWVAQLNKNFDGVSAKLYIGVDDDDPGWPACEQMLLKQLSFPFEVRVFPPVRPAIICPIWASLARKAVEDGCGYLILWGDDVAIEPENWMPSLRAQLLPYDLGCAVPVDSKDPSCPTFVRYTCKAQTTALPHSIRV